MNISCNAIRFHFFIWQSKFCIARLRIYLYIVWVYYNFYPTWSVSIFVNKVIYPMNLRVFNLVENDRCFYDFVLSPYKSKLKNDIIHMSSQNHQFHVVLKSNFTYSRHVSVTTLIWQFTTKNHFLSKVHVNIIILRLCFQRTQKNT